MSRKFNRRGIAERQARREHRKLQARTRTLAKREIVQRQKAHKPLLQPAEDNRPGTPVPPELALKDTAEALQEHLAGPDAQGTGGDAGLTPTAAAKLRLTAIRNKWLQPGYAMDWAFEARAEDFVQLTNEAGSDLSMIDKVALAVMNDLSNPDPRVRALASKAVLAMKAQSLSNKHHGERMDYHNRALMARSGAQAGGQDISARPGGVIIVIPHNDRDEPPADAIDGLIYFGGGKTLDPIDVHETNEDDDLTGGNANDL